jgi:hypothetical protein
MNQCDGCRIGYPIRNGRIHYDPKTGLPYMVCGADWYLNENHSHGEERQTTLTEANADENEREES